MHKQIDEFSAAAAKTTNNYYWSNIYCIKYLRLELTTNDTPQRQHINDIMLVQEVNAMSLEDSYVIFAHAKGS